MTDPRLEAARSEVERSRAQLLDTAKLLQQRLQPGKLTRDAWESAKDRGADLAEDAVDAVRKRPYAVGGVVAAIALFIAREPVMDLVGKLAGGMTSKGSKQNSKRRKSDESQPAKSPRKPNPARAGD
jgi:hypothetical protein